MTEQLVEIRHKIIDLIAKKKQKKLNKTDERYLELLQETLIYIRAHILHKLSLEILQNNQEMIQEYQKYLNENIHKYSHRLQLLLEKRKELSYTGRIDKKIEKTKKSLEETKIHKESFLSKHQVMTRPPKQINQVLLQLFNSPKMPMLNSTRFFSGKNDFLTKDPLGINHANIYLVFEVFKEHKSENLKKLLQIEEIKEDSKLSDDEKKSQIEQIKASIPEHLKTAEIHTLDRLCYYSASPLRLNNGNDTDLGKFKSSSLIDDQYCYGSEEVIQPVLDTLQIALILDAVDKFTREEFIALVGEKNYQNYQTSIENNFDNLTGKKSR